MSASLLPTPSLASPLVSGAASRQRVERTNTNRVRRDGKFFRLGSEKFYVKGVTYGPFERSSEGEALPEREQIGRDFQQILELGANVLRVYHTPPGWFMDMAQGVGLKIFIDVAWPKNLTFVGDSQVEAQAHQAVREAARGCGNHPAIFAISVVNEVPPDIVRFVGRQKVERFIDSLVDTAKEEAPDCLITFASFPTTEYLQSRKSDFVCFNVYLHNEQIFRNYLARLQMMTGEKPLMLGEYGVDTLQEKNEAQQAEILSAHVRAVFDEGLAGTVVFSFTDDWFTGGSRIEDWAFGLTRRDRSPKPSFDALRELFRKVPQVSTDQLPMCSVVICSYNGAGTVEACLRSMERLRYPNFEIIFIDDGSTDATPQLLEKFPQVRNIRQQNMGLSYARNVGLEAAKGEIVVYTDSDCEADEDWLYYLALALARSSHVGVGGPNLIPDEGSWVADCVGLSPGGPTHVMIDDRTAEHVPGCNMAFWKYAAVAANGFDPQFRKAGDDVDFIWRLQQLGYTIGFSPSAQVWHFRRNTIKAYLKQQRGYGEAEALLKYKHPDKFNALGASHWRGTIYHTDRVGPRIGGDVVYHGVFGTGLFQTIYQRPASLVAAMLMSVEWQLLCVFVGILGLAFNPVGVTPLLIVAGFMALVPMLLAMLAAIQAPSPRHAHWLSRPLIALLHYRQPIARGWARYSVRLKAKVLKRQPAGYRRPGPLPFDAKDSRTLRYWSAKEDRLALITRIAQEVRRAGWRTRIDSGWAEWDMEIYASRYVKVRLTTATEIHRRDSLLTRVRVELLMSKFCIVLILAGCLLTGLLLMHLWPFSRTAALLPLAFWTMYSVNRWRVGRPVYGLIDEAAEQAGFVPAPGSVPGHAKVVESGASHPA